MTLVAGRDGRVFGLQLMMAGRALSDTEVGMHLMQERNTADLGLKLNNVLIIWDRQCLTGRTTHEKRK